MTMHDRRALDSVPDHRWRDVAHRWSRHAEHAQVAPVKHEETVQLGRGAAEWRSVWACGLDSALTLMACDKSHCTNIALHADWVAIIAPTALDDTVRVNAWEADCAGFYFSASPDGYCAAGGGRAGLVLGLRRSRLAAACAALAGTDPDDIQMRDLEVQLGRDSAARLHAMLWAAIADSLKRPISEGRHALSQFWEEEIFERFADILVPLLRSGPLGRASALNALRIVRTAEAACADLALPPNMSDLCAAAGVGERWLRKCFMDVRGAPPAQYLLMRRLSAAHNRLLDPSAKNLSVKDVALSFGFMDSGRFAHYYRRMFGVNPSETLLLSQR
jgi:AraC-like DNA-binding protein